MHSLLIVLLLNAICSSSTQPVPSAVKFLEEDAKIRRQGISYATSVIHQDPRFPDQHAESNVKVDFHPQQQIRFPLTQTPQPQNYKKRPKAVPIYGTQQHLLQQIPQLQDRPKGKEIRPNNIQYADYNSPQTQSFNVGYSVSFTGNPPALRTLRSFPREKLENAEIITGSYKDTVQKPQLELEPNEYVQNALIDLKKQKVSGIKPKLQKFNINKDPNDAQKFVGNLAPKTQQYLSYLGDAKPIASSNIRFRQQLQVNNRNQGRGSWTNLSPSVEIYHSKEVPQTHSFSPREQIEQSKRFDHKAALGKSQGFDYTNALAGQAETPAIVKYEVPNIIHQEVQQALYQPLPELEANLQSNPIIVPFTTNYETVGLPVVPVDNLQINHKSAEEKSKLPLLAAQSEAISKKFPMDTSLLRDPILAAQYLKSVPNDPHTIAIPYDTTLLQAMQQKLVSSSFEAKGQVHRGITDQYHGQENQQVQLQNDKNVFQQQGYPDYQPLQTQQFQVFESPQALFLKNGFDNYFEQFDKALPDKQEKARYPKVNISYNINKVGTNKRLRSTKGIEIRTNLQPPPMQVTRHRRMFVAY